MWKTLTDIWKAPDLRSKVLWTLGILVLFRFMASIPIPFANVDNIQRIFQGGAGQVFQLLNLFSGGALERFSIVALGVNPYINASIIMQLLTILVPQLEQLSKEGQQGRHQINRYTRYLMVPLAAVQAWGLIFTVRSMGAGILPDLSAWQQIFIILTWTAGSVFLMWLGDLISEKGVGNGASMLIFAGIVVDFPRSFTRMGNAFDASQMLSLIILLVIIVAAVAAIIFMNEAERQIPVAYAKRIRGNKSYGGQTNTHLPLRLNQAGVIPIIFASSILLFPQMIAQFFSSPTVSESIRSVAEQLLSLLSMDSVWYQITFFILVALFTYFYTFVTFKPDEVSENIQKQGGFILGIRPGRPTAEYLRYVLMRTTFAGAIFLGSIAVLFLIVPSLLTFIADMTNMATIDTTSLQLQGTGLLIVVSVVLETIKQLESMLVMRNYEGLMHK